MWHNVEIFVLEITIRGGLASIWGVAQIGCYGTVYSTKAIVEKHAGVTTNPIPLEENSK